MRAGRLLSILMLLQLRERLTAEELAAACEVSVRTIYRDIEELSASGVPIFADRGPGGGFALVDGYRTTLTGLGQDEAEAVTMIGMPVAAEAIGLGGAAASAGRKLLASLPPRLGDSAARLTERFHVDLADWYRGAEGTPHLPAMARAVLDQRTVEMTYESWNRRRDWRVDPLGLVLKATAWYVVARHATAVLTLKVAGITALTVTEATFERPDAFDLPAHWAAELVRFEASLRPSHATLLASPLGLSRLCRLGRHAARAVAEAGPPDSSGWATVQLPVEPDEPTVLLLLGLGAEIEVLAPATLRDRLRGVSAAIAAMHQAQELPTA